MIESRAIWNPINLNTLVLLLTLFNLAILGSSLLLQRTLILQAVILKLTSEINFNKFSLFLSLSLSLSW